MKRSEAFLIGVGVRYLIEKYDGDIIYGLKCWIAEKQREKDIGNARIFDPLGDEIIG